jgi:hypothetical protein
MHCFSNITVQSNLIGDHCSVCQRVAFVYVALLDVAVCDAGRRRLGNLVLSCIKQKKTTFTLHELNKIRIKAERKALQQNTINLSTKFVIGKITQAKHDFHKNVSSLLKKVRACAILRFEKFLLDRHAILSNNLTPLKNAKVGSLS